jgi:hypothetical protein
LFFVPKPSCRLKETDRLIQCPSCYWWQTLVEQIDQLDKLAEPVAVSIWTSLDQEYTVLALIARFLVFLSSLHT